MHFYCRRRIRLQYPRMRVLVENTKSGHMRYYPMGCSFEIINFWEIFRTIGYR